MERKVHKDSGVIEPLDQKVFEMIAGSVETALNGKGFRRTAGELRAEEGKEALFLGAETAYSVVYQENHKRFTLRTCEMEGEKPDGKWKAVSMWLYDPETDTPAQAQSIAEDFAETLNGPRQSAVIARKKRKKDDDNNVDPLFFFNRFVGVFPELKEELNAERAAYGTVRAVTFARQHLLPKINALVNNPAEKGRIAKCCQLFNDLYVSGDMDVRSIITIVILNGIEGEQAVQTVQSLLSEDLLKSYKAGLKMKGKKVKPEKKKKPKKRIVADTLQSR